VSAPAALGREAFVERLRAEGGTRYHDAHPFHVRMHAGTLRREELQAWVANRYYYQTRIPIKDALILAKSEDPAFRRMWIHRLKDHDGEREGEGGLARVARARARSGSTRRRRRVPAVLPGCASPATATWRSCATRSSWR
jgi:pyrroloquinoline-quinone synthase